jgi:putative addiction module component (TIGR02574 family)
MTATAEQVLEAACSLNEEDRALLIDALIATLSKPELVMSDPEWLDDIRRRSADVQEGRVTPIPWSEVEARADRRIQGHA